MNSVVIVSIVSQPFKFLKDKKIAIIKFFIYSKFEI